MHTRLSSMLCAVQVETSASDRFLVQGSPGECLCVDESRQVQR